MYFAHWFFKGFTNGHLVPCFWPMLQQNIRAVGTNDRGFHLMPNRKLSRTTAGENKVQPEECIIASTSGISTISQRCLLITTHQHMNPFIKITLRSQSPPKGPSRKNKSSTCELVWDIACSNNNTNTVCPQINTQVSPRKAWRLL